MSLSSDVFKNSLQPLTFRMLFTVQDKLIRLEPLRENNRRFRVEINRIQCQPDGIIYG